MGQPYTKVPPTEILSVAQGANAGAPQVKPIWHDSTHLELDYSHSEIVFEAVKFGEVTISVKHVT
ncbi:MAG: hypothetical protein ACRED8_09745 [Caulobacteraceae bacterium]